MKIFNKKIIILTNLIALLLVISFYIYLLKEKQVINILVEARVKTNDTFQLFYDTGAGFNDKEIINAKITEKDEVQNLIFTLNIPQKDLRGLRLDPGSENKEVKIKQITLKTKKREIKLSSEMINKDFLFSRDISEKRLTDGFLKLGLSGNDPQIVYNGSFIKNSDLDDSVGFRKILLLIMLALLIVLIVLSGPAFTSKLKKISFIKICDYYFLILFFSLLCVPISQMILKYLPEGVLREGRPLATLPRLELLYNIANWHEYLKSLELFFEDNYGLRASMINSNLLLNLRYFNINLREDVIIGSDGWLFYDSRAKGDVGFSSFYGKNLYNKNELNIIKKNLLNLKVRLKEKNIDLVLVMAANKESVYSEYLPDDILSKKGSLSKADQISQISEEIGLIYVDTRQILLAAKNYYKEPLYYKGDTHWNDISGFIVSSEIIESLSRQYPSLQTNNKLNKPEILKISPVESVNFPDLARMINFFNYKKEYNFYPDIKNSCFFSRVKSPKYADQVVTNTNDKKNKVVIFGDSFSSAIVPYLCGSFSKLISVYIQIGRLSFDESFLNKEQPNIVIIEFQERFSDQLIDLSK